MSKYLKLVAFVCVWQNWNSVPLIIYAHESESSRCSVIVLLSGGLASETFQRPQVAIYILPKHYIFLPSLRKSYGDINFPDFYCWMVNSDEVEGV